MSFDPFDERLYSITEGTSNEDASHLENFEGNLYKAYQGILDMCKILDNSNLAANSPYLEMYHTAYAAHSEISKLADQLNKLKQDKNKEGYW